MLGRAAGTCTPACALLFASLTSGPFVANLGREFRLQHGLLMEFAVTDALNGCLTCYLWSL